MMDHVSPQKLTRNLGGHWHGGRGNAPCPVCQPERRRDQNALSVGEKDGRLLLHCHKLGCVFTDILVAAGVQPGHYEVDLEALERAKAERLEAEVKAYEKARAIWDQGRPLNGTHGERYLRGRGINCPLPNSLRWVKDTYHTPSGQWCSAIVGNILSLDGEAMGVHRTFFTKQGERLSRSAKMMLATCKGGAVRMSEGVGPLVVSEGIEDGLALLSGVLNTPVSVWAALSSSGMSGLQLPHETGELLIAHDNDDAGRIAANKLAERADALGWVVSFIPPPAHLKDWGEYVEGEAAA